MAGPLDTLVQPGFKSDYVASGPIAGVIASQQMQDWMDSQGRSFRDSDLSYQSQKNKYENEMLDNPLKEQERANKLSAAQDEGQAWSDGTNKELATATRKAATEEQYAKASAADRKKALDRADTMYDLMNRLEDPATSAPGAAARNADLWEKEIYPALKAKGMDGRFAPKYDPAVTHITAKKAMEAAVQTREYAQKYGLKAQEIAGEESVAHIRGKYGVETAAQQGVNAAALATQKQKLEDRLEGAVLADARRTKTIAPEDVDFFKASWKEKVKPESKELQSTLSTNRNEYAQAETEKQKEALAKAAGIPWRKDMTPGDYAQAKWNKQFDKMAEDAVLERFGNPKIDPKKPSVMAALEGGPTSSKPAAPAPKPAPPAPATTPTLGSQFKPGVLGQMEQSLKTPPHQGTTHRPPAGTVLQELPPDAKEIQPGIYWSPTLGKIKKNP